MVFDRVGSTRYTPTFTNHNSLSLLLLLLYFSPRSSAAALGFKHPTSSYQIKFPIPIPIGPFDLLVLPYQIAIVHLSIHHELEVETTVSLTPTYINLFKSLRLSRLYILNQ